MVDRSSRRRLEQSKYYPRWWSGVSVGGCSSSAKCIFDQSETVTKEASRRRPGPSCCCCCCCCFFASSIDRSLSDLKSCPCLLLLLLPPPHLSVKRTARPHAHDHLPWLCCPFGFERLECGGGHAGTHNTRRPLLRTFDRRGGGGRRPIEIKINRLAKPPQQTHPLIFPPLHLTHSASHQPCVSPSTWPWACCWARVSHCAAPVSDAACLGCGGGGRERRDAYSMQINQSIDQSVDRSVDEWGVALIRRSPC
jgi:hypothetical protein